MEDNFCDPVSCELLADGQEELSNMVDAFAALLVAADEKNMRQCVLAPLVAFAPRQVARIKGRAKRMQRERCERRKKLEKTRRSNHVNV